MCIDEVMFALTMLKDKASTWFEFVTTRAKGVECKSGQRDTFTLADNVVYNMILRKTVYPEVVKGTYQYNDGSSSNEYNHHYGMAMELVHERRSKTGKASTSTFQNSHWTGSARKHVIFLCEARNCQRMPTEKIAVRLSDGVIVLNLCSSCARMFATMFDEASMIR